MRKKMLKFCAIYFLMLEFSCMFVESSKIGPANKTDSKKRVIYRVAVSLQIPFVMKDKDSPRGYQGYCIDLLDEMAKVQNFDYILYEMKAKSFGAMNSDGKWFGVVGELVYRRADIGLPLSYVTLERDAVVNFTTPLTDMAGLSILMKREVKARSLFKFVRVLEWDVWLGIFIAFLSSSSLMWMIDRWSPYSARNDHSQRYGLNNRKSKLHVGDFMWFCWISLTPQGPTETPKPLSGKIVAATWWMFGFIIISSYTANLAAFLTVTRLDRPVESLDDLSNQFKIKYSALNASTMMAYFQRMSEIESGINKIWQGIAMNPSLTVSERLKFAVWDDPIGDKYNKLWRVIQDTGMPNTMKEAIQRVRKSTPDDGFAFLGDGPELRYMEATSCDLKTVGKDYGLRYKAMVIQEDSPLKEMLDDAIFELTNRGFMDELQAKWWSRDKYNLDCTEYDDEADEISVDNIGGLFILILTGILMTVVVIAIEFLWFKKKNRNHLE